MNAISRGNEFHLTAFDPGGVTGWAHFVVDTRAFSRPEHKVMKWLLNWEAGEFEGPEHDQLKAATSHVANTVSVYGRQCPLLNYHVVSEDFDLVQTVGSKQNLLSPVRINAVLEWECRNRAIKFNLQNRNMRTSITPDRLNLFGFRGRWRTSGKGKDKFAAMQHGVTWLRRIKDESRRRPWKLPDAGILNAFWDCACADGGRCDMVHP